MLDLNSLYQERVVYSIQDMERAKVRLDLTYRELGEGDDLKLDIYYPPNYTPGTPLPAAVMIHGEWPPHIARHSKDLGVYVSWGQLIAASGIIAINFNHRITERFAKVRDAASDVAQLLGYIRYYAKDLDILGNRLCIWAFSAGMPLGMWAALRDSPSYVRSVVSYYGVMDLQVPGEILPEDTPEDDLRDFSALHYLDQYKGKIAPMLIAKAGLDSAKLNATIDRFVARANRYEAPVTLLEHPQGHHGFDLLNDDDRSRQIIRETLNFIVKHT